VSEERHSNDWAIFNVPSVVLISTKTAELYVVDSRSFGFGSTEDGQPLDEKYVRDAGFEIIGEL